MSCPRCHSKVDGMGSGVGGALIRLCSNPACDWEELPQGTADPNSEDEYFQRSRHHRARHRQDGKTKAAP